MRKHLGCVLEKWRSEETGPFWAMLGEGAREIGSVLYCSALCRALRSSVLYNTVLESSAMERRHARGARVPRALAQYLAVGESPQ